MTVRSASTYVSTLAPPASEPTRASDERWGERLAEQIDAAIATAAADRDVLSVAVTPINGSVRGPASAPGNPTIGAIVTVVWRERTAESHRPALSAVRAAGCGDP